MDIPQIIAGRFRIECEIGRGGMGAVYRASHLGLERPVAIKVLKKEFTADPEVAERFMREARTMARLRHPRAAMIFDAGRLSDGRPFIVMEYAEGQTLAEALTGEGRFEPERAVRVAAEICEVLAEAHALGIVHRDLKPSNIMLTERGVCVLDFGIAKVLAGADVTRTHATTESGVVIGTPRYMSPEQCLGQQVGAASDLYSVGVLVYEMLAGRPPFVDQLASAVLVKQATQTPAPLLAVRPDAPRALALAVHTLLSKNPANRPRTAADARATLLASVRRAARREGAQGEAAAASPFASTIDTLNTGRTFARAVAACAVLAMLGAVGLAWASRPGAAARADVLPPWKSAASAATAGRSSGPPPPPVRTSGAREGARVVAASAQRPTDALTAAGAERVAAAVSPRGHISQAHFVRAGAAQQQQTVAAIHDEPGRGGAHLFVMRLRGNTFRVTGRAQLDTPRFRAARWTQETLDLDGDGHDELLCTGTPARPSDPSRRYVLYVPRTGKTYSLTVSPAARGTNARPARWSANALTPAARPFRAAILQRQK
jgi:tRNA A-37 threonylcarbamoyl transferase component Bud32